MIGWLRRRADDVADRIIAAICPTIPPLDGDVFTDLDIAEENTEVLEPWEIELLAAAADMQAAKDIAAVAAVVLRSQQAGAPQRTGELIADAMLEHFHVTRRAR